MITQQKNCPSIKPYEFKTKLHVSTPSTYIPLPMRKSTNNVINSNNKQFNITVKRYQFWLYDTMIWFLINYVDYYYINQQNPILITVDKILKQSNKSQSKITNILLNTTSKSCLLNNEQQESSEQQKLQNIFHIVHNRISQMLKMTSQFLPILTFYQQLFSMPIIISIKNNQSLCKQTSILIGRNFLIRIKIKNQAFLTINISDKISQLESNALHSRKISSLDEALHSYKRTSTLLSFGCAEGEQQINISFKEDFHHQAGEFLTCLLNREDKNNLLMDTQAKGEAPFSTKQSVTMSIIDFGKDIEELCTEEEPKIPAKNEKSFIDANLLIKGKNKQKESKHTSMIGQDNWSHTQKIVESKQKYNAQPKLANQLRGIRQRRIRQVPL